MLHVAASRPSRLVEYFVQVGLQHPLTPLLKDAERPITDLRLVFDREDAPEGFEKLEFTVSGGSGNLSAGGNVFSPAVWLCVSRAANPLGPITDLTILYLGREDGGKLPAGYTLLDADLNKGSYGYNIALAYTRQRLSGSHTGPLLDIAIVNVARRDALPPRYRALGGARRNVNAGSLRDEIYLSAKFAIRDPLQVKYKPMVLDRYPAAEIPGSPLSTSIALFCCPDGIELVPSAHGPPPATYASTVLTTDQSVEVYCACLTFYETYHGELPRVQDLEDDRPLSTRPPPSATTAAAAAAVAPALPSSDFSSADSTPAFSDLSESGTLLYAPRKLCLVSFWPFFSNFCQYLEELYRHSRTTTRIPLERLLVQLWETPLPNSTRMRVQLEMGASGHGLSLAAHAASHSCHGRLLVFERPMPDDFPLANFPLSLLFRVLSLGNIAILLSAVLQEKKIVLASKTMPLLTYAAEAVRTLIFPLKWMHPYVPILPAPLAMMLDAPMPIFVGVAESFIDSRVLSGDDIVIVYLDRDEIKIGGNGKEAYSTNSAAHAATSMVAAAAASANASPLLSAMAAPSSSSAASASINATSSSSTFSVPDKLPNLTLLPRKLLQRLALELRTHTNVTRLKRFASQKELEAYFHCFRSASAVAEEEVEEESPDEASSSSSHSSSRSGSSSDLFGGSSGSSARNLLAIRACFLHVFVTLLGGMDAFLRFPAFEKGATHTFAQLFDLRSFLARSESKSRPFLRVLVDTQMFNYYVEEKTDCTNPDRAMELAFFAHAQKYELELEASIEAVRKMGGLAAQSAPAALGVVLYLSQLGSNYTTYLVPPPDTSDLAGALYSYAAFPTRLNPALLRKPTPPPTPTPEPEPEPEPLTNGAAAHTAAAVTVPVTAAAGANAPLPSPSPSPSPSPLPSRSTTGQSEGDVSCTQARHVKSASTGGAPPLSTDMRPVRPTSNGLSTASLPTTPRAAGTNGRPSFNPPPNGPAQTRAPMPGQPRMFVGTRGPTAANFRPTPSAQQLPPEKKDRLSSIIDFLTAVRMPAPPPSSPVRPVQGQRTAPTTPQRAFGTPTQQPQPLHQPPQQRNAPYSVQRASSDSHRRVSAPPNSVPRPINGNYGSGGGGGPAVGAILVSSTGTPQSQQSARSSEAPPRTLNFDSAVGYQAPISQFSQQTQIRRLVDDLQRRGSYEAASSSSYRPRVRPPPPQSLYSDNIHQEPSPEKRRSDINQTMPPGTTWR